MHFFDLFLLNPLNISPEPDLLRWTCITSYILDKLYSCCYCLYLDWRYGSLLEPPKGAIN